MQNASARAHGLGRGQQARHQLHEAQHGDRVEEVHADHPLRLGRDRRQLHDRDRRRVAGEQRVGTRDLAERQEDRDLLGLVLDHRLDHQVAVREVGDVRHGADPALGGLPVRGRELAGLLCARQRLADTAQRVLGVGLVHLADGHVAAGARGHLRDAGAHDPAADHSDGRHLRGRAYGAVRRRFRSHRCSIPRRPGRWSHPGGPGRVLRVRTNFGLRVTAPPPPARRRVNQIRGGPDRGQARGLTPQLVAAASVTAATSARRSDALHRLLRNWRPDPPPLLWGRGGQGGGGTAEERRAASATACPAGRGSGHGPASQPMSRRSSRRGRPRRRASPWRAGPRAPFR